MGMRGAGISTSITFALEGAFVVAALTAPTRGVSLRRDKASGSTSRFEYRAEARALLRVANPAVLERVLYHAGYLGFIFVLGRLGDASMAANQSLISVESICFLSADGFGLAAAALVAQKLGAGEGRDAARAARIAMVYAIVLLTTLGLAFLAARRLVLPIFSTDAEVDRDRSRGGPRPRAGPAVHGDGLGPRAVAPRRGDDAPGARRERRRARSPFASRARGSSR